MKANIIRGCGALVVVTLLTWAHPAMAQCEPKVWAPLATGMNDAVAALTTFPTPTNPTGDLIAGGNFLTVGGVAANYIARWDGSAWFPLGTGMDDDVYVLTTLPTPANPTGDLIAGGFFTTAGGVVVNCIARWNGSVWAPFGSGMNSTVYALTRLSTPINPTGDLIAGGWFTAAGGVTAKYVARWNGSAWTPLGTGVNYYVEALAKLPTPTNPNGDLIAGGYFTAAGGVTANHIARWNGSAWVPLGAGMNDPVYALTTLPTPTNPSGDLFAGGDFVTAGGIAASRIARWNGSAWAPLGTGVNKWVNAITALPTPTNPAGDLIAGGVFTASGSVVTPYIARWGCPSPSPCYADCDASGGLTNDDFICFQTLFALGDPVADCDGSGSLNIDDFICYQTYFAIGC